MLSQRRYKQILIFNNSSQYCVLGMYIGIHNDGFKDVCCVGLNKVHDIFKPKNEYSDCLSLPAEWMQIIDPNYSYKNIEGGKYPIELPQIKRRDNKKYEERGILQSSQLLGVRKKLKL